MVLGGVYMIAGIIKCAIALGFIKFFPDEDMTDKNCKKLAIMYSLGKDMIYCVPCRNVVRKAAMAEIKAIISGEFTKDCDDDKELCLRLAQWSTEKLFCFLQNFPHSFSEVKSEPKDRRTERILQSATRPLVLQSVYDKDQDGCQDAPSNDAQQQQYHQLQQQQMMMNNNNHPMVMQQQMYPMMMHPQQYGYYPYQMHPQQQPMMMHPQQQRMMMMHGQQQPPGMFVPQPAAPPCTSSKKRAAADR